MSDFNDIGISRQLDWPRIRHLFRIGCFGSLLGLAGDLILGWGVEDESLAGFERMLSAYTATPDGGIFAAALLGLFGLTLAGLSFFGVYRLMAERAPEAAHRYRAGILGTVIFGPCGFHLSVCAAVFLRKHSLAPELLDRYLLYFLMPALALFAIFYLLLTVTQLRSFARGRTPYPRWCWVFSPLVGMAAAMALSFCGNQPLFNAIGCAWIGIGNLWSFAGLLATAKKAHS